MPADRFSTLSIEGAILPPDLLRRVAENDRDLEGLSPDSYELVGEKLNEAVSRAWNRIRALWVSFRDAKAKIPEGDEGTKLTRDRWLIPLFKELEYGLLSPTVPFEIDGKLYPITHSWQRTPIHLVGCGIDLDKRPAASAHGARMSPHGLVQEFLNRSGDHLWAFVSNGLSLRILRDSVSLTRQAFVEFDLEAMLQGEVYSDFVLLWMLCHASRVRAARPEDCWLEKWSKKAQSQGTRALDQLRGGVERAIEALGRGFLKAGATSLREALASGALPKQEYYRHLLRLVYRLLFMFVAEDRDLLLLLDARAEAKERYREHYSTVRLRRLARAVKGTPHGDLWQSLLLVMNRLGQDDGCAELALPALGSFLWSPGALGLLGACTLDNRHLLDAVRALTLVEDRHGVRAVDWRNLGAEELGSIYESLLELHPDLDVRAGTFELKTAGGNERKTTGSYYTPTSLVTLLLDSALDPVLDVAAKEKNPEKAILGLRVVDPACGSGHFLIAAAHRIAKRLAFVRTGNEEPAPADIRHALRDVIGHCIYGVDLNEMAVELCKVSLWMEALEPGRPLSFLDSKIRVGNALLGATPALIARELPDAAYEVLEGDDRKVVAALKKRNKQERRGQAETGKVAGQTTFFAGAEVSLFPRGLTDQAAKVEALPDDSIDGIRKKESAFCAFEHSADAEHARLVADAWCAAFFWLKVTPDAITSDTINKLRTSATALPQAMRQEVERLRDSFRFFHWHLAFPDVCRAPGPGEKVGAHGWVGGFDVVLGNPPWETRELKEKEFFAERRPEIATAGNASIRKKMIEALREEDPLLFASFLDAVRLADAERNFFSGSGRYPLCGHGRVNTYSVFAEWNRTLLGPRGRLGNILPSGIATDDTTKEFFQELTESRSLVRYWSFAEIREFFPDTDSRNAFALLVTAAAGSGPSAAEFAFDLWTVEEAAEEGRRFTLTSADLRLLNPNTRTCPTFRSSRDAEITKNIYRRLPVLVRDGEGEGLKNPWGVRMQQGLFNMASDSHFFRERSALESAGWKLAANAFVKGAQKYLPLYEAKMIHLFDHRFGTYEGQTEGQSNQGILPRLTPQQRCSPDFSVLPWFWVPAAEVDVALAGKWTRPWMLGWRDICRNSDERTAIASFFPRTGAGDPILLLHSAERPPLVACLAANLCSLVFDFVARQKFAGTHLKFFTMKQVPVTPPSQFLETLKWLDPTTTASNWFSSRVLELTYVSRDMEPFARDLGYGGEPFRWDEVRRANIRAELDAAFLHLYGLDRSDAEHVLESFPVLKKNEVGRFGEYRTRRLVLEQYDSMADAMKATATPPRAPATPPSEDLAALLGRTRPGDWAGIHLSMSDVMLQALPAVLQAAGRPATQTDLSMAIVLLLRPYLVSKVITLDLRAAWERAVGDAAAVDKWDIIDAGTTDVQLRMAMDAAFAQLESGGGVSRLPDGRLELTAKGRSLPVDARILGRALVAVHMVNAVGADAAGGKFISLARRRGELGQDEELVAGPAAGAAGRS